MKALFLQHDHLSPPGLIGDAFAARGYDIVESLVVPGERYTSPNVDFQFPDPAEYDVLVPMGSPWGAWDDATIGAWLQPELEWLRSADRLGVPVFGICFGGQILARAYGGTVAPAPRGANEIGWALVMSDEPEIVSPGPWFQFHYDRWTVPPGAREIARNTRASQAFILRRNLALQFHPEVTGDTLREWGTSPDDALKHIAEDGQDPQVMLAMTYAEEPAARARAHALVDGFLTKVAST